MAPKAFLKSLYTKEENHLSHWDIMLHNTFLAISYIIEQQLNRPKR